jgi:hypothetical protein
MPLARAVLSAIFVAAFTATTFAADVYTNRRVLGGDNGHVAIVNADGKVLWETPTKTTPHDLALLENGNILFPLDDQTIIEMTPENKVAWKYTSKPAEGTKGGVQVHAFQRLPDGNTMIAESGNRRLIEVDKDGKIVKEVPLTVEHPDPHRDTRMARKLANGHYLVCHEGDGKVREYDGNGKTVWTYALDLAGRPPSDGHGVEGHGTAVFGALRLDNGNTLISCGNGNRVIEVDRYGKTVWSIEQDELPGIKLAWVTDLQVRDNGNVIFGNCHAGPENPQIIEVDRNKKVVWAFKNFQAFGNSLAVWQVLDSAIGK